MAVLNNQRRYVIAEKVPLDESQQFSEWDPEAVINTSASDFSLSFAGPDGVEHEIIHDDSTTSDVIALTTAIELNVPPTPTYQERFTVQLDEIRTIHYLQEAEFVLKGPDFSWPPSLGSIKVKFKRGLKQIKS